MSSVKIKKFTFNPFSENTWIVSDSTSECVIIDAGCSNATEENYLSQYIDENKLKPVYLLHTHGHIDHIMGSSFVKEKWKIPVYMHKLDVYNIESAPAIARMYGIPFQSAPLPDIYLNDGDQIKFGETVMDVLFTPGHSPGSVSFYIKNDKILFSGDVLFYESIGRTDLPGGDMNTLENTIRQKLYALPENVQICNGHGPETSIAHEKKHNPFVQL